MPCGATLIWTGRVPIRDVSVGYGYNPSYGDNLDNTSFTVGANSYTVDTVSVRNDGSLFFSLDKVLAAGDRRVLAVHACEGPFRLATATYSAVQHNYVWQTSGLNWSGHAERIIYLSQDVVAPTFVEATVDGTSLVITFNEELGAAASLANDAFTVKKGSGGTDQTLTGTPSISGKTVTLTLDSASPVTATDEDVKVAYTKPDTNPLKDLGGREVETFADQDVNNQLAPRVSITAVHEDATPVIAYPEFRVTRSASSTSAMTVNIEFADPHDFLNAEPSTITIPANQTSESVTVFSSNLGGDTSGTVTATVVAGSGYLPADAPDNSATVEMKAPDPILTYAHPQTAYSVEEGESVEVELELFIDAAAAKPRRQFPAVGVFTEPETAAHLRDYEHLSERVQVSPNDWTANSGGGYTATTTYTIQTTEDSATEGDETFRVRASTASGGPPLNALPGRGTVTITIVDDETLQLVRMEASSTPPGRDYYVAGDTIEFTAVFTGNVTVTGTPRFTFNLGGQTRQAAYARGSDSKELVFSYTVAATDPDEPDGVSWAAGALSLNGGAINLMHATPAQQVASELGYDAQGALPDQKVDTMKPEFSEASVNGATLVITFSEALNTTAPANAAFTVKKTPSGGSETTLAKTGTPSISGRTVTLTLDSASSVTATDKDVKVAYTKPATNPIKDLTGKEADAFGDQDVTNLLGDNTPPVLAAANPAVLAADGVTLTITYNETLKTTSVPDKSVFTVKATPAGGSEAEVGLASTGGVAVSGSTVALTLAVPVTHNDTGVKVKYDKPQTGAVIQDAAGNEAASFPVDQSVTNNSTAPRVSIETVFDFAVPGLANPEFRVTRSNTSTSAVTVDLNITQAATYLYVTSQSITIPANQTTGSRKFVSYYTGNRRGHLTATVVEGNGYAPALSPDDSATLEMRVPPTGKIVTFAFGDSSYTVAEGDSVDVESRFTTAAGIPEPRDTVQVMFYSLSGTADNVDGDYVQFTEDVNLDPWLNFSGRYRITKTTTLQTNEDDEYEGDETYQLAVSAAPGHHKLFSPVIQYVTITILDDDDTLEVSTVEATSTPTGGYYGATDTIEFTVTFNGNVTVDTTDGTPQLAFELGGQTLQAAYATGSGSKELVFSYTVAATDPDDHDGVSWAADALSLNGGTIKFTHSDPALQVAAGLDHDAQGALPGQKVDTMKPEFSEASVNGTSLVITFTEELNTTAPANAAFTVKKTPSGGSETTLAKTGTPSISGRTVTLTLASASSVTSTDKDVKVAYAKPATNPIKDLAGKEADAFGDQDVTNLLEPKPTAPAFADGNGDGYADPVSLSVAENAASGSAVGTVAAVDADGDALTHSVRGDDDAVFNDVFALDPATGEITVKTGASPDFEARASYSVIVSVTDGEDRSGAAEDTPTIDDRVRLTVNVTDLEEAGSVSLSTESPQVNAEITATVSDPDGSVRRVSWRWRKSATETGSFTDISGATGGSYTPGPADEYAWLRAAASYTDRRGAGKTAQSLARQVQPLLPTAPAFADADSNGTADPVSLSVAENAASGSAVGTVAAVDANEDPLTHSVGGADADAFNGVFSLDAATGAITVKVGAALDFEARASYSVTVSVTDREDESGNTEVNITIDDTVALTISVTDREEAGSVSLSTASPQVGAEVTATVSDPDGSVSDVSWQWRKWGTEMGDFTDISGATGAAYTPGAADEHAWLRAAASYTDRRGSGKTAESAARQVGSATPTAPDSSRVLVSNFDGRTTASSSLTIRDLAQEFTTGSHGGGYNLHSIEVYTLLTEGSVGGLPEVSLRSGSPTGPVAVTLTAPDHVDPSGIHSYTASTSGTSILSGNLSDGTSYWVVIEGTTFVSRSNNREDRASAEGWTIANVYLRRNPDETGGFPSSRFGALTIRVNGTIVPGNYAPEVATEIPDQSATVGVDFNYQFPADTFTDADDHTLTYTATETDRTGLPIWLSLDGPTRTFSGTPREVDPGTVSVQVTADDGNGGTVFDTFVITVNPAVPGPPTRLIAKARGTSHIQLSWRAPASTGGATITGYKIEVSTSRRDRDFTTLVADTGNAATIFNHTGLQPAQTRFYRVSAINSAGTGPQSNVANAISWASAPGAPGNLTATASGQRQIDLNWTAPAFNGGLTITGYSIEISTDGTSFTILEANTGNTDTTYRHAGLQPRDTRYFRVAAINIVGAGSPSNIASATTPLNFAPTVASEIPNQSATAGAAFVFQLQEDTFYDVDGHTLTYVATADDGSELPSWLNFDGPTRTFSGTPQAGDAGTVSVKVTADDGNGGMVSDTFDITVAATAVGAIAQVTGVTVSPETGRLRVQWTAVSGAGGYKVQWKSGGQDYGTGRQADITPGSTASYVIYPLNSNTSYTLRVIATRGGSDGPPSTGVTGTPGKVTPTLWGVWAPIAPSRFLPGSLTGLIYVGVEFPGMSGGYIPVGIDPSDLTVENGTVTRAIYDRGDQRAQYWVDVYDPPSGGSPLTITFHENAIDQGNHSADLNPDPGFSTAEPLTFTMTTSAQEPVTGDFDVIGTFSRPISVQASGIEAIGGQWPTDLANVPLRLENGSLVSHSTPGNPASTLTFRVRPRANFEGILKIVLPGGRLFPASESITSTRNNNRSEFQIAVDTLNSGDAALATLAVNASGSPVTLFPGFYPDSSINAYSAPVGRLVRRVTIDAEVRHEQAVGPEFLDGASASLADADSTADGHQVDLQPGVNTVKVRVTAENGRARIYTLTVVPNAAPTLVTEIPDQSAVEGRSFSYQFPAGTFNDADNHTLLYSATRSDGTDLPSWLNFDRTIRTFSGTPQTGDAETVSVTLTADDGFGEYSGTASDTFLILVVAPVVPDAPTGLSATEIGRNRIDLQWAGPASDGGADLIGYRIEVSTDRGTSFADLVANTGNLAVAYSHTGIGPDQTRHYRVSAINSVGPSSPSTTLPTPPPTP